MSILDGHPWCCIDTGASLQSIDMLYRYSVPIQRRLSIWAVSIPVVSILTIDGLLLLVSTLNLDELSGESHDKICSSIGRARALARILADRAK